MTTDASLQPARCFPRPLLMRGGSLVVFPQGASRRKVGISPRKLGAEFTRLYPQKDSALHSNKGRAKYVHATDALHTTGICTITCTWQKMCIPIHACFRDAWTTHSNHVHKHHMPHKYTTHIIYAHTYNAHMHEIHLHSQTIFWVFWKQAAQIITTYLWYFNICPLREKTIFCHMIHGFL